MRFDFGDTSIIVNVPTRAALIEAVRGRLRRGEGFALATINLDHLAKMSAAPDFARVYAAQDLVVADGRPIVALARLAGKPVELLPGSDLVVPLCRLATEAGVPVALIGTTQAALDAAARVLSRQVPGLAIALAIAPSARFDPDGDEAAAILRRLDRAGAGLCLLALGAPKQEMLALRGRRLAPRVGFASIGAGLDFLGGHQRRAPRWLRWLALEWLWRALGDPVRLGPRYARAFAILPRQILRALRQRRA